MADSPCKNPHCKSYGASHPNCQCYGGMAKGGIAGSFCDKKMEHKPNCQLAKGGFVLDSDGKDHYVIKHPKGDVLRIAKHGLSPQMHAQIKQYAKGGEVNASSISQGFSGATGSEGIKQGVQNIKNYAEGTPEEVVEALPPEPQIETPQMEAPPLPDRGLASAPEQSPPAPEPARMINPELKEGVLGAFHKMMDVLKAGGPTGYIADKVATGLTKAATVPNPKVAQPQMMNATADQPAYTNVPTMPNTAPSPHPSAMTAPQMPSIDPEIQQLQKLSNTQQARTQEMHTRAVDILHDLNTDKIDFHRAWSDKSVPSKILAGIGIVLSGMGSGLTGQPNMAMEMINKEIDRDIDQQKTQIGKKATALEGYIKQYGSETSGANALREDLQALTAAKMQQYSLKMQGNMMKGMQGGEQGMGQYLSYLRMTNPNMAKSVEERMVPSLGGAVADVPPTAEDRDAISKGMELDNVLNQLERFSKTHSGSLDPRIQNQGKALASRGKELLRQANKQGVFKESEQKFDEGMIPSDPTKFFADYRTLPQYETMRGLNKQSIHNTVGKYFVKNPLDQLIQPQLTHRPGVMKATGPIQNVSQQR